MADSIATKNIGSNATLAEGTRDQSGDGDAIVAAPGAGKRVAVKEIYVWLTDPATEVDVTLKLGDLTLPVAGLSSSRGSWGIYRALGEEIVCSDNGAVYVNLGSAVSVGVMCFYNIR